MIVWTANMKPEGPTSRLETRAEFLCYRLEAEFLFLQASSGFFFLLVRPSEIGWCLAHDQKSSPLKSTECRCEVRLQNTFRATSRRLYDHMPGHHSLAKFTHKIDCQNSVYIKTKTNVLSVDLCTYIKEMNRMIGSQLFN